MAGTDDGIELMKKIWDLLNDNNVKSFSYSSDDNREDLEIVYSDHPKQVISMSNILNEDTK